ncbi:MAG: type I glyceraldehyde-3-phosphate dehydrogenase [Bacteroidetes bacterium]|nr:type I glyceraldehyde-3-phosphate dehydrogenase [Bacteroidota bacterium]
MKKIRVAINGFGRIGRVLFRVLHNRKEFEIVAVNDLADARTLAHLLKYDSIHRIFDAEISSEENSIIIDGKTVKTFNQKDLNKLNWRDLDIDFVVEATGLFKTKKLAGMHIDNGAKKVIISAPPEDDDIKTIVLGINEKILNSADTIISNASCTTNNAAPLVKVIDDLYGIDTAYITTVHSYTTDQKLHDVPHKDLRRARAGAQSIVPTTTGAAKAITKIFPHLDTHIGGCGIRVPVPDGSLTDITFNVKKDANIEEINRAFKNASENSLKGILKYIEDPIVSTDIIGNPYSCTFDSLLTSVIDNKFVKVVGWYDNEMGYSNRLADLMLYVNQL